MAESKSIILLPDRNPDELVLTFAGNVVKHLGVQMYAGRPVPAIAELVSNSWDADAKIVDVRVPLGSAWNPINEDHIIEVEDDGRGMTWEMVRDSYLDVGRDRREAEKTDRSKGGRLLQGRKGIGKLAGFGIADMVEVQTVHEDSYPDIGERVLIWFRLSLEELKKVEKAPAPVDIIYAGPMSKAPVGGRKKTGTTVTLRQLHQRRTQSKERFHWSMAKRFLLIGPGFLVRVNGQELREEHIPLQWRWPEERERWADAEVEGCGPVQYWIGFTKNPRKQSEGEQSGIFIYTRSKVSQEATFFDISGGVTGQHGLRYMVGMVKVEWLDVGIGGPDLIATHRGAIAWESPQGSAFQTWGQNLIKKHLVEWAKKRAELRERQILELSPEIRKRIETLTPAYKQVATRFYEKFKTIEMEPEEFENIVSWFLDALENATLRNILIKLRETNVKDLEKLDELLSKMEIRTAVTLLQIIESNLAAIETLKQMHLNTAAERGVISKHLEKNPWLINPTWILNSPEGRVSTWIKNKFGLEPTGQKGDLDRADFLCVGVGGTLNIVEIKRGRHIAIEKDFLQANKYREYVLKRFGEISESEGIKYGYVVSHLIAAELNPEAKGLKDAYGDKGWVYFTSWSDLIEQAKIAHKQFRDVLKKASEKQDFGEK